MAEIAAELGLSRKYVSCVVNGSARRRGLSEKTIERVREHLVRRGFVPSRHACNLRAAPDRVIGILYVGELFSSHLIEGFHGLIKALGTDVQGLEISVTCFDRVVADVRELLARRVTDLVWVNNNSQGGEQYRWMNIAQYLMNTRTIIYNYPFDSPHGEQELLDRGVALVGVDRLVHNRRLARLLKAAGHSTIVLPDVQLNVTTQSYYEAFQSEGLTVADYSQPFTVGGMLKAMKEQGATAVCFHGDSSASLALCELRAAGIRVPEDLTLTGFDGTARAFNSDLTTLAIPVEKMVAKVRELIAGTEQEQRHCFDLELVEGRTHGPPRKENLVPDYLNQSNCGKDSEQKRILNSTRRPRRRDRVAPTAKMPGI